jgi:regulation of enolase protein 1 (concanavalin A-like superfamily)
MAKGQAIIQSNNQDLFICGYTYRNRATGESDVLLIKTNSNGDTLWTKTYGGNLSDNGSYIINSSDGNIVICGTSCSYTSEVYNDIYLVKVNTNGDTLWTKTYRDHEQEIPYHLMQTENGEYLITGRNDGEDEVEIGDVYCANPSSLLHLLKVDIDGNKLWHKNIGTHCWNEGYSTLELTNGDLLTCGRETDDFYTQLWLVKIDNLGNVIWERNLGDVNNATIGYSMAKNSDNTYTVLGTSNDESNPDDVIILKIDQQGDVIWSKKFGGQKQDWGFNIIKDSNDDNIITGMTYSYGQGASDGNIFMTKTDGLGNFK